MKINLCPTPPRAETCDSGLRGLSCCLQTPCRALHLDGCFGRCSAEYFVGSYLYTLNPPENLKIGLVLQPSNTPCRIASNPSLGCTA